MIRTREEVTELAVQVREGNQLAFKELEGVAKPLLVSLSNRFCRFHPKFEFEDFYSMALGAMYRACLSYSEENPSFLDYAKIFILREFWHEVKYWNAQRRNIFDVSEVSIDYLSDVEVDDNMEHEVFMSEFRERISTIINDCFAGRKADILKKYIVEDCRPTDIAKELGLKYKNVYSVIERGTRRIISEYNERYIP